MGIILFAISTNNEMICKLIFLHVIVLLVGDNKIVLFLLQEIFFFPLKGKGPPN